MKTITIAASSCRDMSREIEKIISEATDLCKIVFEKGTYPLSKAIEMKGKKGIILEGYGATLSPFFDRCEGADTGSGVFELLDCSDITFKGFAVCSPVPVNMAGKIVGLTEEYADVLIESSVPITGDEQFIDGAIYDAEGRAKNHYWVFSGYDPEKRTVIAGEIPCTAPRKLSTPYELIGKNTVRVYSRRLVALNVGANCSISHSYYGLCAFVFRQCENITFEDVKVTNFAGFGFLILPNCRNFTFKGVKFQSADKTQPLALNSDGIHTTGLSGDLVIKDCDFYCIGDDVLNVHTQVMTTKSASGNNITVAFDKINGIVSPYWSKKGDMLRVYDQTTLALKGKMTVLSSNKGELEVDKNGVDIKVGDFVTNDKYYPDVTISNCRFHNWRTRITCLQGVNSLIMSECEFENVSKKALFCTTAFEYWMEAGPLQNVCIRDNVFKGIGEWYGGDSVVFVGIDGKTHKNVSPIHKNIRVQNNHFENIPGRCIEIHLSDDVTVSGNTFVNCPHGHEDIAIENCTRVTEENNTPKDSF